jgi:hypothetical protein
MENGIMVAGARWMMSLLLSLPTLSISNVLPQQISTQAVPGSDACKQSSKQCVNIFWHHVRVDGVTKSVRTTQHGDMQDMVVVWFETSWVGWSVRLK